ncbi:hypothetical protein IW261DRAFT_1409218 [Armillaria novae-zelandiae]|uniref:Uncharacterized protein n=1 Tax=Armillaria novae-zelandiae TaxID=153914 RepID=A0AA39TWC3_9AGAR|nr:hypothetical protein IW261DRAFT_1409218 [Armillaria novae-zelandiae]
MVVVVPLIAGVSGSQISPSNDDGKPVCTGDRRTLWSIVWSCIATIFVCTWIAIHPDVPGRKITTKGAISCVIQRAMVMVMAILAPEFIVGWAASQFITSVINPVPEQKKKSKLTMAHGFFLCMGGFYYTRNSKNRHEGLETDKATSTPPSSSLPSSTIEDKSKGDAFSKMISILQLTWFIVQCVARANQHLPITLLEMSALAFTGPSIITYFLWWYKPLNVKYHISLDEVHSRQSRKGYYVDEFDAYGMPLTHHLLKWNESILCSKPWCNVTDPKGDALHFWTMVGVGCFFGAVNCLAWSFSFPSHAEMVLWRASSLGIFVAIFGISCTALMEWSKIDKILPQLIPEKVWMFIQIYIPVCIGLCSTVTYIFARIMLLTLAYMQLFHLSPLSFCTVQWTTYIPHI